MSKKRRPLSIASVTVLHAMSEGAQYGFEIMDATELPSGTVYPILGRLERSGLVRARWERVEIARREKRPPRRYYALTKDGSRELAASLERLRTLTGPLPAAEPRKAEA